MNAYRFSFFSKASIQNSWNLSASCPHFSYTIPQFYLQYLRLVLLKASIVERSQSLLYRFPHLIGRKGHEKFHILLYIYSCIYTFFIQFLKIFSKLLFWRLKSVALIHGRWLKLFEHPEEYNFEYSDYKNNNVFHL